MHGHVWLVVVECAHLRNNGFLKPSPYVEFTVDGKTPRRTDIVKTTCQPKWNEDFTVLVTNRSQLHFSVIGELYFFFLSSLHFLKITTIFMYTSCMLGSN